MDTASGGDLIDVIVRLPRETVENALLSARGTPASIADQRVMEARVRLQERRSRAGCFNGVRFCEPSWDMILELYVATREGRPVKVTQLCGLSGGSITTALRHIERLEALGYIARATDYEDKRSINVLMLAPLQEALEQWLDRQIAASEIRP